MNAIITTNNELQTTANITDLAERWSRYIDATERTAEAYTKNVRQFMLWLSDNNIDRPTREDIITYREHLKTSGKKPATIQAYIISIKQFFKWADAENLYPNIADHVKGAKLDREYKKDYLTTEQVKNLLAAIDRTTAAGKRDYAIIAVQLTTGLRATSIINADIGDIRPAGDNIALYYKGKGHAEKGIYVKLAQPVQDAINDYLAIRTDKEADSPLFASVAHRNGGGRMTTRSISRIAKERMRAIGLDSDRLTDHSFRHTAGVQNLLNGGTLEETQKLLNHSNINTTTIYAHIIDRANNPSEARLAAAFF